MYPARTSSVMWMVVGPLVSLILSGCGGGGGDGGAVVRVGSVGICVVVVLPPGDGGTLTLPAETQGFTSFDGTTFALANPQIGPTTGGTDGTPFTATFTFPERSTFGSCSFGDLLLTATIPTSLSDIILAAEFASPFTFDVASTAQVVITQALVPDTEAPSGAQEIVADAIRDAIVSGQGTGVDRTGVALPGTGVAAAVEEATSSVLIPAPAIVGATCANQVGGTCQFKVTELVPGGELAFYLSGLRVFSVGVPEGVERLRVINEPTAFLEGDEVTVRQAVMGLNSRFSTAVIVTFQ